MSQLQLDISKIWSLDKDGFLRLINTLGHTLKETTDTLTMSINDRNITTKPTAKERKLKSLRFAFLKISASAHKQSILTNRINVNGQKR